MPQGISGDFQRPGQPRDSDCAGADAGAAVRLRRHLRFGRRALCGAGPKPRRHVHPTAGQIGRHRLVPPHRQPAKPAAGRGADQRRQGAAGAAYSRRLRKQARGRAKRAGAGDCGRA